MTPLGRIAGYLRPHRARVVWAVGAMLVVAAFNGGSILILKPIVDHVLIARDFHMLGVAVVCVPLVVLLKSAVAYLQNYMMSWLGQRVTQDLRSDLFRHLLALPLDYFESHESGEILARVSGDLAVVQAALNSLPLYLIRDSMTVVVLLGSLFYLDWRFALLSLAGVPLIAVVLVVLSRKMRAASAQAQGILERLAQRFQDGVEGAATVKAFNYEDALLEKFEDENESFFAPMMSYLRATALSAPLMELAGGVVAAIILYFGGREVILGRLTPGAFFAFLGAFFAAYAPVKNVARSNSELQRALTSAERLFAILEVHPSSPVKLAGRGEKRRSGRPASFAGPSLSVEFQNVSFRYPGSRDFAVKNLSFSFKKGERVALVGPSGSGKSTVANLLLRMHEPASGRILFDGKDARELDPRDLRAEIGFVAQDAVLFNDSVFENVALGRSPCTLSEIERACALAGAAGFIARLPQGYSSRLGAHGVQLSAGQRQKLAIARVVLKDPSIVVLDEATANLDGPAEAEVLAALERLFAGRTVVTIGHKLESIPHPDRILVLGGGELVEQGTHDELWASGGLYRKLYDLQAEGALKEPA